MVLPACDLYVLHIGRRRVLAGSDVLALTAIHEEIALLPIGDAGRDIVQPVRRIVASVRRHLDSERRGVRRAVGDELAEEIGRAHVWTPVTNAHLVCRLLLEKKNTKSKSTINKNNDITKV